MSEEPNPATEPDVPENIQDASEQDPIYLPDLKQYNSDELNELYSAERLNALLGEAHNFSLYSTYGMTDLSFLQLIMHEQNFKAGLVPAETDLINLTRAYLVLMKAYRELQAKLAYYEDAKSAEVA